MTASRMKDEESKRTTSDYQDALDHIEPDFDGTPEIESYKTPNDELPPGSGPQGEDRESDEEGNPVIVSNTLKGTAMPKVDQNQISSMVAHHDGLYNQISKEPFKVVVEETKAKKGKTKEVPL